MTQPTDIRPTGTRPDTARQAERAWCDGDPLGAMELADRALAAGTDPDGRAAGVAAAASAADGALHDAARRWRGVASGSAGAYAAAAGTRAALVAALAGDLDAAGRDLGGARACAPDPPPRGLAVLLDGTTAVTAALRGDLDGAARRLVGLAAATVPPDLLAAENWNELAACVVAAGGDARSGRTVLDHDPGPTTTRRLLLGAWLDLRAGRTSAARDGMAAVADTTVLRRNAVLAAAVSCGLARRGGNRAALTATWHRVAPVVAGCDVEVLLLDVWGELSVAAAAVAPTDGRALAAAMADAVARAGSPWWASAAAHAWQLERAVVDGDPAGAVAAAHALRALAADHPGVLPRADAGTAWAGVLAERVSPDAVGRAAAGLAAAGLGFEAAALCGAAATRVTDPDAARDLLLAGRRLRARPAVARGSGDDLSPREREVGALVVDGLTHKEIGSRLYISPKTVEQHVARLRQKLAASTRSSLVAALRARL